MQKNIVNKDGLVFPVECQVKNLSSLVQHLNNNRDSSEDMNLLDLLYEYIFKCGRNGINESIKKYKEQSNK